MFLIYVVGIVVCTCVSKAYLPTCTCIGIVYVCVMFIDDVLCACSVQNWNTHMYKVKIA